MSRRKDLNTKGDVDVALQQPLNESESEPDRAPKKSRLDFSSNDGGDKRNGLDQFMAYPIHKVNRLLEPGPILLVATGSLANKTHNIMTMGFHMMIQHEGPTLVGACIGPWDKSYDNLKKTGECVLAIPAVEMLEQTVDIGNCSGEDVNKWVSFGINPVPKARARAPLVGGKDVIANIQCMVEDRALVAKYNLWVLKVTGAWINKDMDLEEMKMAHHRGDGRFVVDGKEVDMRVRMVKWKEFQD
nr:hypothetical protein ANI_1_2902014 [Aspergillus niger CBS 513.88]|eukprot:XP_001389365.2 hypothetical protein ANI_1_2902014 [Aspergillus niger CBS 513.88]